MFGKKNKRPREFTPNPTPDRLAARGKVKLRKPVTGAGVTTDIHTVVPGATIVFYHPDGTPLDLMTFASTGKRDEMLAYYRRGLDAASAARILPC